MSILDHHLQVFCEKCDMALQTYSDAMTLINTDQVKGFSSAMKDMIIENIILHIFSDWERFLEDIFIDYMRGEKSDHGIEVARYVYPMDEKHAYDLIKSVTAYPDWTDIDKILTNATNFFEHGGPFILLKTLQNDLNAIKRIRNAVAHTSKKARKDFENLVLGKVGYLPNDITPVSFITEYKINSRKRSPTFFEYYLDFLRDSAVMLVEFQNDQEST